MRLDLEYCLAREAYCIATSLIIDRFEEIKSRPLSEDFKENLIKTAGVPEPYTAENFEDIISQSLDEYIQQIFNSSKPAERHQMIKNIMEKAPLAEEITADPIGATWKDMQHTMHEGLEGKVIRHIPKYILENDPVKLLFISCQENYHRIYSLVEKARPESIHDETIETPVDIESHTRLYPLVKALSYLQAAKILTEENRSVMLTCPHPDRIASALSCLLKSGILNQSNFDALMLQNHSTLLTPEAKTHVWDKIQEHGLDQTDFQKLLIAAEQNFPLKKLQLLTSECIGKPAETPTLLSTQSMWLKTQEGNGEGPIQSEQKP